jgi:hypothetical protein
MLYRLRSNFMCAIMSHNGVSHEDFCAEMLKKHGKKKVAKFEAQESKLRKEWEAEQTKNKKECVY